MPEKKCHINLLNSDKKIETKSGTSLMESFFAKGVFLRSDCGGKGICGKCKVKVISGRDREEIKNACLVIVKKDMDIEIPESSLVSFHTVNKPPVSLPLSFKDGFNKKHGSDCPGIAVDLGTTTIAIYLCDIAKGSIISSLSVKNPQAIFGDDVMTRIGNICQNPALLERMQSMVVMTIEKGIKELFQTQDYKSCAISQMTIVGNPTMIHIFTGVNPKPIGTAPYMPDFYEARQIQSKNLGFEMKNISIQTLPLVSGFIGPDIIGATMAVDMENQPRGTLLVDLGTNGELVLKGKNQLFASSCATGPAFEGASLSCGMQAIAGAINKIEIRDCKKYAVCSYIPFKNSNASGPSGVCGSGIISIVAQLCKKGILDSSGAFKNNAEIKPLKKDESGRIQYVLVPQKASKTGSAIFISQKDIRSVQLAKAALITGIEFLLRQAGMKKPEKIIIAGAFGSYLNKEDLKTLGMLPAIDPDRIELAGNAAGAGAVMTLCKDMFLKKAIHTADKIMVVDLVNTPDFQNTFVKRLAFPFE